MIVKTSKIALAALLVVLAAAVLYLIRLERRGFTTRAEPSAAEKLVARTMRNMAIPRSARTEENPWKDLSTPENLQEAREHFADHCALCHGNDGSGDTAMGRGMYPKPPDLRARATQSRPDGEIFWIIENGVRLTGMPAFGRSGGLEGAHTDPRDSWKLVLFIRHLPALTAEERIEMEKYNPKGPDERREEQEENDFLNGAPAKPSPEPEHHHH